MPRKADLALLDKTEDISHFGDYAGLDGKIKTGDSLKRQAGFSRVGVLCALALVLVLVLGVGYGVEAFGGNVEAAQESSLADVTDAVRKVNQSNEEKRRRSLVASVESVLKVQFFNFILGDAALNVAMVARVKRGLERGRFGVWWLSGQHRVIPLHFRKPYLRSDGDHRGVRITNVVDRIFDSHDNAFLLKSHDAADDQFGTVRSVEFFPAKVNSPAEQDRLADKNDGRECRYYYEAVGRDGRVFFRCHPPYERRLVAMLILCFGGLGLSLWSVFYLDDKWVILRPALIAGGWLSFVAGLLLWASSFSLSTWNWIV